MLHSTSVKTRLFVSVVSNAIRAMVGFISGLLIARGLNPAGYGDLMFLLGSFVAIRSVLDMGSSSAFYTFLSQHQRSLHFYLLYFSWLAFQFIATLIVVAVVLPADVLNKIWLGHSREIVVLALMAAFMQQQVWQVVGQIGEARRKTVKVQLLNLAVAFIYLAVILMLLLNGAISVHKILVLLCVQYAVAAIFAYWVLRDGQAQSANTVSATAQVLREYWKYCRPLIGLSAAGFLYDFFDKWMLQRFGGASQQGYFQIAYQFSAISLLATTSILNIFWKEIADASAKLNHRRVAGLYQKVSRGLVMLGAIVSGLLVPWSEQIVTVFLGDAYTNAWPALAIMLLYPIHQSMGQIGGTMFLASGQTQKYLTVSLLIMLVSIPFSYFALAPSSGLLIPGLELGAIGLASKMVLLNVISVNIQSWAIARYNGWPFDWQYQLFGIPLIVGLGYLVKMLTGSLWNLSVNATASLIVPFIFACSVYAFSAMLVIWLFPWLIGTERDDIKSLLKKFRATLRIS